MLDEFPTKEQLEDLERRIKALGYGDTQDGPEEDSKPIVTDEDLEDLQAAIEKFNEEQANVLISPEQAQRMMDVYADSDITGGPGFFIQEFVTADIPKWRGRLSTRELQILEGCEAYTFWGSPGHNVILLVKRLAEILDEGA